MSSENLEITLADLKRRITAATAARARAQVEHERAVADRDEALASLRSLGAKTPEDVAALLAKLEKEAEQTLTDLQEQLEKAGV